MTEEASGGFADSSFKDFWHRSVDKISTKKIKFMPNVTNLSPDTEKKEDESRTAALTQKQHRRAQVRKAQIEHRQRKQNYIKHLEQDIIELREKIGAAQAEGVLLQEENTAMKRTLPTTTGTLSNRLSSDFTAASFDSKHWQSPQDIPLWLSSASSGSFVDVSFDQQLDASCLQITTPSSSSISNHELVHFNALNINNSTGPIQHRSNPSNTSHHKAPACQGSLSVLSPSQCDVAVNFILALEHPCRTHFHASPVDVVGEFDPTAPESGHELMASTFLYSHAPPPVFDNLDAASWSCPSLELTQLYAMSLSLPTSDFEITPVQAWFLLSSHYEVQVLLSDHTLKLLKKGLGSLVQCFAFGAVMDEARFWEVVEGVLGGRDSWI